MRLKFVEEFCSIQIENIFIIILGTIFSGKYYYLFLDHVLVKINENKSRNQIKKIFDKKKIKDYKIWDYGSDREDIHRLKISKLNNKKINFFMEKAKLKLFLQNKKVTVKNIGIVINFDAKSWVGGLQYFKNVYIKYAKILITY